MCHHWPIWHEVVFFPLLDIQINNGYCFYSDERHLLSIDSEGHGSMAKHMQSFGKGPNPYRMGGRRGLSPGSTLSPSSKREGGKENVASACLMPTHIVEGGVASLWVQCFPSKLHLSTLHRAEAAGRDHHLIAEADPTTPMGGYQLTAAVVPTYFFQECLRFGATLKQLLHWEFAQRPYQPICSCSQK